MIRIALTKGRIEECSVKLFELAGYDITPLLEKGRKLIIKTSDNFEFIFAKAADVITFVEHGVCDLGIVGRDTLLEAERPIYELLDLGFGSCRFALCGPVGKNPFVGFKTKSVASKYPNVTAHYFERRGLDVEIVKIEGSVELAPLLGLCDAIVDIVETGSTLKANGLEVYENIADISARLVANEAAIKLKREEISKFTNNIKSKIKG